MSIEGSTLTDDATSAERSVGSEIVTSLVHVTGRLTQDPQTRELADGTPVCDLRLEIERMGSDGVTGFIDVATFGPTAKSCASVLEQGWLVAVAGQLDYHERPAGEGSLHSVIGDIVSPLRFSRPRPVEQVA